jgi:hypothetical protein
LAEPMKCLLLLLVALVGCSKKPAADEARAACTAAMERGVDLSLSKRRLKQMDGEVSVLAPKMKSALADLCVTDAWPADVVSCFQTADDIAACRDKLAPHLRQRFVSETMKVRLGKAGSGSDSGSDGSGSGQRLRP